MRIDVLIDELVQSWRSLLRRPGYLILASGTLALGVAACVSVFSLVQASLLAKIAVPQVDRVVMLGPLEGKESAGGMAPIQFQHLDKLPGAQTTGIAAPAMSTVNVLDGDRAAMVASWRVSDDFLKALAMPMRLGRGFNSEEGQPNGPAAVLISLGYWKQNFGEGSEALGRMIQIDGRPVPIVGVLPAEFPFPDAQLLLPLALPPNDTSWSGGYQIIARLQPGISYSAAAAAVTSRMHPLDVEYKMDRFGHHDVYVAQPLEQALRAGTGSQETLALFAGCAGVVLLIVLVNLSNLSLLRILSRTHDNAVRRALGSPTLRLLLPAMADQLLVAAFGGLLGLAVAWVALRLAESVIPPYWFVSAATRPTIGFGSIIFTLLLALFVTAVALLASAWRARFESMQEALVGGVRSSGGRKAGRIGRVLVTLQAALATVLLMMAALCARTLWNSSQIDYGFDGEHVLGFSLKPDRHTYPDQQAMLAMADALVARLEALPGATRAGYGTNIPASGTDHNDTAPFVTSAGGVLDSIPAYLVSPGYLDALGIGLQQGRSFDPSHVANADSIIISSQLSKTAQENGAIGQQLTLPYHSVNPAWTDLPLQIRGISKGVRANGPNNDMPPIVWIPFMGDTSNLYDVWRDADSLYVVLKVQGNPITYESQVTAAVRDVAPTLSVGRLQPVSDYQSANLSQQRLNLALILLFAGVALLLSSVGMYCVMAVSVASRKHELGIRAALGAQPLRLLQDVLLSGGAQVGIGLVIGLGAAFAASRLVQRFLFGVSTVDPAAIAVVVTLLFLAGLLACLGPATRAARVQPMQALRIE